MTWAENALEFRSLWVDELRLYIDGRDVTRFRGVESLWQTYELQDPLDYGPASFRFPQINDLEIRSDEDDLPTELKWMRQRARVRLVPIIGGVRQAPIYRGFVDTVAATEGMVELSVAGEATGRLALTLRAAQMFRVRRDVGTLVFEIMRDTHLRFTPRRGPETGVVLDVRGSWEDRLSHLYGLLADAHKLDGTTYTVRRHATKDAYEMVEQDTTTVHYTLFAGTQGVRLSLSDNLSEKPNTFYGNGIARDGHKWGNGRVPAVFPDAPPYPMAGGATFGEGTTNGDTLTGEGISVLHSRLIALGVMERGAGSGVYDDETADAVELVQDAAGLPETGEVNPATWDAIYDVTDTGLYSIRGAQFLPLAQNKAVREWDRIGSGAIWRKNPDYDPEAIPVERFVAHGNIQKRRARRWSRRQINISAGKNCQGTISLVNADLFEGDQDENTANETNLLSRFLIKAGRNVKVMGWDGEFTLFRIVGVRVSSGGQQVDLMVDTQMRDRRTVGEIVARNRESRRNRGRDWKDQHRTSAAVHDAITGWFEQGGILGQDLSAAANTWTVFPLVGGQEGTVAKFDLTVDTSAYAVAVFGEKVTPQWLRTHIGNPFTKDADGNTVWLTSTQTDKLFNQRTLLYATGTTEEPCGYWPKRHTKEDQSGLTSAPITGRHVDDGGFPYRCYDSPLLWVAVYPLQAGTIKAGRIMWQQIEEGT